MKNAIVLGGSGHIGSYFVPKLVEMGYAVTAVSRSMRPAYTADDPAWERVWRMNYARDDLVSLEAALRADRPEVICDTLCYRPEQAKALVEMIGRIEGYAPHLIHIGSTWVFAEKLFVPVDENHVRNDTSEYGVNKTEIEAYLHAATREGKIRATVLHPGHVSGRGWVPINPQGNGDMGVFEAIRDGRPILLPDDGSATLHHVHSADIAGLMAACIRQPEKSVGESFNAVSPQAMSERGFAEWLYRHYGHTPKIDYLPMEEFCRHISPDDVEDSREHARHSTLCSMEKARKVLGFEPKWTSQDTILDALDSLGL